MKKSIMLGLFICFLAASAFASTSTSTSTSISASALESQFADLPIPSQSFVRIVSEVAPFCVGADSRQNMVVKACAASDPTQKWIFLGMPYSASPYTGFNFLLINLGFNSPKIATCEEYPKLIDYNPNMDLGSLQYRMQTEKAINCASDGGSPLTIDGSGGAPRQGTRLQFWGWHNQSNQHWTIVPAN